MDGKVVIVYDILQGHKTIIQNANKGDLVIKFDQSIGMLSQVVKSSEYILTHNLNGGVLTNYGYSTNVKTIQEASDELFWTCCGIAPLFNRILCTKGECIWERNKRQNLNKKLLASH